MDILKKEVCLQFVFHTSEMNSLPPGSCNIDLKTMVRFQNMVPGYVE